ncbi:YceI-like domain-containing protein [Chitinophaga sp. CF118]|uniref:YceI family protein n=1 Tax=Chitinophaga sp. CF118 TaxID=1884367 RepID=UPI0008F21460|nr:YceI family protein [Chitinophaga sp. CF118]SFE44675.1 YceI-like domain-containing protein [Chitinophaga sp. CF118]
MKTTIKTIAFVFFIQLAGYIAMAQVQYQQKNDFNLTVNGTSTLHDWEMKTSKIACNATFTFYEDGELGGLTLLNFTMPAESLKSERSGMDDNAYRALKTSKYPTITFDLTTATVSSEGTVISCKGKLSLAGVTKDIDLLAKSKLNTDKSINIKGSKKINMRDFGIDPPSFMMGAVKTGENVTISFDLTFRH